MFQGSQQTPELEQAVYSTDGMSLVGQRALSKLRASPGVQSLTTGAKRQLPIPANNRPRVQRSGKSSEERTSDIHSRHEAVYLPVRTSATWTLGLGYQYQRNYAKASQAYMEVLAITQGSGNLMLTIGATICQGQIQEAENQLTLASETYQRALQLAGNPPLPAACEMHLGLARILYEWNDLDAAQKHGQQGLHLARQLVTVDTPAICQILLARLNLARGDVAGATALVTQADQFVRQQNFLHRLPEVVTMQVLLLLHQGQLTAAAQLAQKHELPISQARVYLADGDPSAALVVLTAWRRQLEARGWQDEQLKAMVLQAVALQIQGKQEQAVQVLCDALVQAAPGGFIRIFVDEGKPMVQLLSQARALGKMRDYIGKLLAACNSEEQKSETSLYPTLPTQPLIEPLSRREREVLQLLAQGLSNQEISERLVLSLETVKGHNKKIFGKLQVQRRTEAVARARQLGLL